MTCDVFDGVALSDGYRHFSEGFILGRIKGLAFQPFQLNPDGVIVAIVAAPVVRSTCVPGSVITADKLNQVPIAADKKMR